jgi:hypothetical protein
VRALPSQRLDGRHCESSVKTRPFFPGARAVLLFSGVMIAGAVSSSGVRAQGIRISGVTSMQAVDLRPLIDDSVAVGSTTGTGPYRVLADGRLVRCIEGEAYCRYRSSGARELVAPVVQDLRAVAWGFGEGISAQAHVRARGSLVSATAQWPRADDAFDAIEAWLEIDRGAARARLGRQWVVGGLGVFNYDGASLVLRRGRTRFEAFGGRSLVAGLNEPVAGAELGAIDDLPPDENGWLLGISASSRIGSRGSASATWQRVIRADRAALYSDRVAADASWRAFGATADASLSWDVSTREVNEASLQVSRAITTGFTGSLEARRHRPFFEAWTIWGAFSPVAFDETSATVSWRNRTGTLGAEVRGASRRYDETNAGLESAPLKRDGWRAGAGADWLPREHWMVYANYDVDIGFGASRSDIVAGARWMPDESRWLGIAASGLQHIYEFRVGTGRVNGVRLEGGTRIAADTRVVVDAALYAHRLSGADASPNWSQRRFLVRLEWTVGRDPGSGVTGSPP